jgi:hypothetical protein
MKKLIIGISVVIIIVLGVFFYLNVLENQEYKEKGGLLIEKVEKYKSQYGYLPETVKDLKIESEMGEGPYYEKVDSLKYIVYFSIGFDNTLMYYSDTEIWIETP